MFARSIYLLAAALVILFATPINCIGRYLLTLLILYAGAFGIGDAIIVAIIKVIAIFAATALITVAIVLLLALLLAAVPDRGKVMRTDKNLRMDDKALAIRNKKMKALDRSFVPSTYSQLFSLSRLLQ